LLPAACKQREDSRIAPLQQDVKRLTTENQRLSSENQRLQEEVSQMRDKIKDLETAQTHPVKEEKAAPPKEVMTVDRMKESVDPLLKEAISKIKASSETPKKANQFGMRVEYDLKRAFYGLVQSDQPGIPYMGKVLIGYTKFLESERLSKQYGTGTTQFLFAYRAGVWSLVRYEEAGKANEPEEQTQPESREEAETQPVDQ